MAARKIVKVHKGESGDEKSPRKPGYSRLHIDIPTGLDIRLGALAKYKGETKAAFAARLLHQGCAKHDLDRHLREAFPDSQLESEPVA